MIEFFVVVIIVIIITQKKKYLRLSYTRRKEHKKIASQVKPQCEKYYI